MKMLFAAVAAVVALCQPAAAAKREAVKLEIPTKGVDFSNPTSVERFRTRAVHTIADFCNPEDNLGVTSPDRQCRRELSAQLAHTIAVAQTGKAPVRN